MTDPPTYGKKFEGVEGVAYGSEVSVGLLSAAFVMLACTRVFDDMRLGGLGQGGLTRIWITRGKKSIKIPFRT